MKCPKCNAGDMLPTYEPYESRCNVCGYWFDSYTGKEVTFEADWRQWFDDEFSDDDATQELIDIEVEP